MLILLTGAVPPTQLVPLENVVAVFPQTIVVALITSGDAARNKPIHKTNNGLWRRICAGGVMFNAVVRRKKS